MFQGLRSADPEVRWPVLEAIARNPAKALSYGPHEGKGLVDEIIDQLGCSRNRTAALALFSTLSVFDDPRVRGQAARCFSEHSDPRLLVACARKMMMDSESEAVSFLEPWIWADHKAQSRPAAMVLAGHELERPASRLRVAILSDQPDSVPPFDTDTEAVWLAEINGPWWDKALALLKPSGREAWLRLKSRWSELIALAKVGLIEWGGRDFPDETRELLADILDNDAAMAGDALRVISNTPALAAGLEAHIAPYGQARDDALRLLAIRAGAWPEDISVALSRETSVNIRCVLLRKAAQQTGFDPVEILLKHLSDPDWRIRSAVAESLVEIGQGVAGKLRPFLEHESPSARITAAWVLERLAD